MSSELAAFALIVVGLLALARWLRRIRIHSDRSWLPTDLHDAKLVYVERLFRARQPLPLVARLDRGYRSPEGVITLVELKTRGVNRPYFSDVIELSAQRVAVEAQTAERVDDYGYVLIQLSGRAAKIAHRVKLLSREHVIAVAKRRQALLAGEALPQCTRFEGLCASCAFKEPCMRTRDQLECAEDSRARISNNQQLIRT